MLRNTSTPSTSVFPAKKNSSLMQGPTRKMICENFCVSVRLKYQDGRSTSRTCSYLTDSINKNED